VLSSDWKLLWQKPEANTGVDIDDQTTDDQDKAATERPKSTTPTRTASKEGAIKDELGGGR
jgi:hypothetical protein